MLEALEAGNPEPQRSFVADMLFLPTDDPALRERVVREMAASPVHVSVAAMRGALAFDGKGAAAACKAPALHIAAEPPLNRQADMAAALKGVINAQTSGAGHFNQLLVPTQVNDMIDYFSQNFVDW